MRCYGFSQGRKSLYNTAVYVMKCFISNIRKNSAIDISPAKLSIGWFALGGEREIREARKSGVWRNQRRKSGPWWKRSTRNGRQRSFSPLTRPSKCRVGRWGAILFHSSYNARVFRCKAPSKQDEWNRIKELCLREHQERQMATGFSVSGWTNGGQSSSTERNYHWPSCENWRGKKCRLQRTVDREWRAKESDSWPTEDKRDLAVTLFKCINESNEMELIVQRKRQQINFNFVNFSSCHLAAVDCSPLVNVIKNV